MAGTDGRLEARQNGGPLAGIRILDLTSVVMGPFATQVLGDLGADVIKIEPPDGDPLRTNGVARNPGMSALFLNTNRNKRSVVLDLKQPRDRDALIELVRGADVLVHSMRVNAMERLGIGREILSTANPRLVHCIVSGYGESGLYAGRPALDDLIQAAAGVCSLESRVGGTPHYAPIFVVRITGLFAVHAIIAALIRRECCGEGQSIEVPMFETLAHLVLSDHLYGCTFDPPLGAAGYVRALTPERRPYTTRDGYLCANLYNDRHWRRFCDIAGHPELKTDPRFVDLPARTRNFHALCDFITQKLSERTTAEWLRTLDAADIPAMPLNDLNRLIQDPHLAACDFLPLAEHPTEGRIRMVGVPTRWSRTPPSIRRYAPQLGEHTHEVLKDVGRGAQTGTAAKNDDEVQHKRTGESPPLAGIRVIDLTSVVLGPYATQMMADLGADVIKVEPETGEALRYNGPARHRGMSAMFLHANRNKRSLVLNLKHPRARLAFLRLAKTADVVVSNVRPQAMKRLGLSCDDISAVNPRIIYCSAVGYGQGGPYAAKPAYDELIQGAVGLPSLEQRLVSRPQYIPMLISDRTAGLTVLYSVLAALFHRERTGEGQAVEVPMFETMAQMVLADHLGGWAYDPPIANPGYQRALTPERRPYATSDGFISVSTIQDRHWRRFCEAVGHRELASDPRFVDQAARVANTQELCRTIGAILTRAGTAEWLERLQAAEVPAAPINTLNDLLSHPHLQSHEFIRPYRHPTEGPIRVLSYPVSWSDWHPAPGCHAPRLGEHSGEILRELGYGVAEIDALAADGATMLASQSEASAIPKPAIET